MYYHRYNVQCTYISIECVHNTASIKHLCTNNVNDSLACKAMFVKSEGESKAMYRVFLSLVHPLKVSSDKKVNLGKVRCI